jgi:hypothetical protein
MHSWQRALAIELQNMSTECCIEDMRGAVPQPFHHLYMLRWNADASTRFQAVFDVTPA